MVANPYRWQHDQPERLVARTELVGRIEGHLRRGVAVKLVEPRSGYPSVLRLRQFAAQVMGAR